jgi:glucose/arabinose dehydrogenase
MSLATCLNLENAALLPGFTACTLPLDAGRPRSVLAVGAADLLVLERDSQSVVRYFDSDGDGLPESKQSVANAPRLNHGIALNDGYIYASSDTIVYRWSYSENFSSIGEQEIVVENINADGQGGAPQGHTTRTLVFDDVGRLYISVGSNRNVDPDSYRSRIRRFEVAEGSLPLDFQAGQVFADGLRNEVGLAFDKYGVLWGVENGADNLFRSDLGGDIHDDNPVSGAFRNSHVVNYIGAKGDSFEF